MSPYGIILSIVLMGVSVQDGHSYYLIDNRIPGYNPYYYNPYINTYVNSYNHIGPLQNWPNIVQQSPYRYLGPLQELYPRPREPDYDYDDNTNGSGDDEEIDDVTESGGVTENSGETESEDSTTDNGSVTEREDSTEPNVGNESEDGIPGDPVRRSIFLDDRDMFELE